MALLPSLVGERLALAFFVHPGGTFVLRREGKRADARSAALCPSRGEGILPVFSHSRLGWFNQLDRQPVRTVVAAGDSRFVHVVADQVLHLVGTSFTVNSPQPLRG